MDAISVPGTTSYNQRKVFYGEALAASVNSAVGIFFDENAITRLVAVGVLEQNDERGVSRRYMTLESRAHTSDNPTVKPPAVAT